MDNSIHDLLGNYVMYEWFIYSYQFVPDTTTILTEEATEEGIVYKLEIENPETMRFEDRNS